MFCLMCCVGYSVSNMRDRKYVFEWADSKKEGGSSVNVSCVRGCVRGCVRVCVRGGGE